jgi:peptide/nickel transport system substrate-binding protein
MNLGRATRAVTAVAVVTAAVALLAGGSSAARTGGSGILRVGTISYIDSLNPYNYIQAQGTTAMEMIYPQLVQYLYGPHGYYFAPDYASSWQESQDGKTWTFHLHGNTKWSDGQPLTASDAAWTINTTLKYGKGPTAEMVGPLSHVTGADAPNPTTLVIHYARPVGNVLAQLEQVWILPKHVYTKYTAGGGAGLKTFHPEQHLPVVSAGAYTISKYQEKGTTVFLPYKGYWGPPSHADAVALTYYTNADSMIADLKQGNLDWVDQVPFSAIKAVSKLPGIKLDVAPGAETTNITWNSNPVKPHHRELLDPRVKHALSMCVNRNQIINVVFQGHASLVSSIVGHIAPLENPNLPVLQYDCKKGNEILDKLGYKRGANGIRIAPATHGKYAEKAHPMAYNVLTCTCNDFDVNREFQIVQEGFKAAGVKLTQQVGGDVTATYALETGSNCSATKGTGYTGFDIAMWDWVGYVDVDFQLSIVTKSQWCSWADAGWNNPAYDKLYVEQGQTVSPAQRKQLVWKMQKIVYDNWIYTQLANEQAIDAHSDKWTGFHIQLAGYAKQYYTDPIKGT